MPTKFDPYNEEDFVKLTGSTDESVGHLKVWREQYEDQLLRLVGPYFGDKGFKDNRPINLGIKSMGARIYKKYRVYERSI